MSAYRLLVVGVVQGVGFRPFVYRLASNLGICGYVRNAGGSEVEIHVEGPEDALTRFIEMLRSSAPPVVRIEELLVTRVEPVGFRGFRILPSGDEALKYSMIPPDIGICDECLREVLDPLSRRYRYPFNSCAWCGPRYSMMYKPPYDRENTSMNDFPLCSDCLREYGDQDDLRRFHAQGISCPRCGPRVYLYSRDGEQLDVKDPVGVASKLIDEGYIVAVKGLGGYHIAALASDDDSVLKLRARKARPQKPFAVMVLDETIASRLCHLNNDAIRLLRSPERPIVLLPKREDTPVSRYVSPGLDVEGLFLPYTALHYLLVESTRDRFVVMTSGNPGGKPMCIDEECAFKSLKGYVDYFLVHDRVIVNRVDDSVVRFTDGKQVLIRRGRGYAPSWIRVKSKFERPVIAFGAELQLAGAVAFDDKVVLTQYIGDAEDYDVLTDLDKYLALLIRTYGIDPRGSYLVVDKHPKYLTRLLADYYASEYGGELVEIQHHYAHALATAADVGVRPEEEFVAVVVDGIGYGDDGNVWGGEVILANYTTYSRMGHLEYVPIPDDSFAKYPLRMLISYLYKLLRSESEVKGVIGKMRLTGLFRYGDVEVDAVLKRITARSTMTSSAGRFLDSISALLGVCSERTYEGEPAIKLEAASRGGKLLDVIDGLVESVNGTYVVRTTRILGFIIENMHREIRDLAYTAQYLLGYALGEIACRAVYGGRMEYVLLGGGASVNTVIVSGLKHSLRSRGISVLLPSRVPPNDGGIALGQAVGTYRFNSLKTSLR